jgi:hypothetical protein
VSSLAFLALAGGLILVGSLIVLAVHRHPRQGAEASIEAFARQLEVLGRRPGRPVPPRARRGKLRRRR